VALDETDVVHVELADQLVRLLHDLVALGLFLTDVEQADARPRNAVHVACDDRAHRRELRELQRRGFGIRAEIEDVRVPAVAGRHRRHDRRALDGPHGLQHEMRHRGEGARISRADHPGRPPLLDEIDRQTHRRILAPTNRVARMLGHADDARSGVDRHARTNARRRFRQRGFDDLGFPHEDELEGGVGDERSQSARNALRRTAVATHHIDGD
jgi:hypothetical protein